MDRTELYKKVDHTLLKQTATWDDIRQICDDAITFGTASVCIPSCYVKQAADYVGDKMRVCTVVGFPNGNCTTGTKVFEAQEALANGAKEIDMVINLGWLRAGDDAAVLQEIRKLREVCKNAVLKVIIETCLLTQEEKIRMCHIVTESGADFIKTSTGFSAKGATFEDIELFAAYVGPNVKIKAAGGISSFEDANRFVELGASRLGTSRIVSMAKAETAGERDGITSGY